MNTCTICGTPNSARHRLCPSCKAKANQQFLNEFAYGFSEADDEIRNANPHIYGDGSKFYTYGFDPAETWGKKSRKQPWPKPDIFWLPDYNGWRVKDKVTEGYVDVPVEAVEAKLGRGIEACLRARVIYRAEIEACAQRLLILLVYGCKPKLNPAPPPPKPAKPHDWSSIQSPYLFRDAIKYYGFDTL